MKTKGVKFLFLSVIFTLTISCAKDPSIIRDKYRGSWVLTSIDGSTLNPVNRKVFHISSYPDLKSDSAYIVGVPKTSWSTAIKGKYALDDFGIKLDSYFEVKSIDDFSMTLFPRATDNKYVGQVILKKLSKTYSSTDSIRGVWEVTHKGDVTYNNFRLKINKAGGTYEFYNKVGDAWVLKENEAGRFYKYDNLLIFSFFENPEFSSLKGNNLIGWEILELYRYKKSMLLGYKNNSYKFTFISE